MSMFFVSAIRTISRGWPRSSSTHEPSDPPLRIESIKIQIRLTGVIYIYTYLFVNFVVRRTPERFGFGRALNRDSNRIRCNGSVVIAVARYRGTLSVPRYT